MPDYSTLKVRPKTKKDTLRLAKKHGINILDLMQAMVDYFHHTGLHPRDKEVLKPAEELKSLRNTIISFYRTQEKDYVIPTFTKMDLLIGRFMQYIEEEAPKKEGVNTPSSLNESIKDLSLDNTKSSVKENESESETEKLDQLKNDYDRLELKHKTTLDYLNSILDNTENKSTGLTKCPVINMSFVEINDIKKAIKKNS